MKAELEHLRAENARLTHENKRGGIGFPAAEDTSAATSLTGLLHRVNHIARIVLDAEKSRAFYEVKRSVFYGLSYDTLLHF
jgi:hypothetical protein